MTRHLECRLVYFSKTYPAACRGYLTRGVFQGERAFAPLESPSRGFPAQAKSYQENKNTPWSSTGYFYFIKNETNCLLLLSKLAYSGWRSLRGSNPCSRRERAMSWAARRREQMRISHRLR